MAALTPGLPSERPCRSSNSAQTEFRGRNVPAEQWEDQLWLLRNQVCLVTMSDGPYTCSPLLP